MQPIIMDTSALKLPQEFVNKINSKRVMISEVDEGLLLTPIPGQASRIRGVLKGTGFSTERYFEQKRADKEQEG